MGSDLFTWTKKWTRNDMDGYETNVNPMALQDLTSL